MSLLIISVITMISTEIFIRLSHQIRISDISQLLRHSLKTFRTSSVSDQEKQSLLLKSSFQILLGSLRLAWIISIIFGSFLLLCWASDHIPRINPPITVLLLSFQGLATVAIVSLAYFFVRLKFR